jgi:hypothetical protein
MEAARRNVIAAHKGQILPKLQTATVHDAQRPLEQLIAPENDCARRDGVRKHLLRCLFPMFRRQCSAVTNRPRAIADPS